MGAGHFSQFEFTSVAEGKPSQPGLRPGLPVFPARQGGCKGFIKTGAEGAYHHPLNPLNPLNLLNPSR